MVSINGERYIIGVPAPTFEFEQNSYTGLGTDTLLYAAIKGRVAGDTYGFSGQSGVIDWVM